MSRKLKLIFTASVLLNVVLLALAAGFMMRFVRYDIPIPGQMSPDARHFIARHFQEGRDQIKPLIDEAKQHRAAVEEIITAEEFDRAAYDKAVAEMLATRGKISDKRADIMGGALADLPQADRVKFANRILDGLEGRKKHRRGFHHKEMKGDDAPPKD